jgi:hypothetical protein
MTTTKKATPKAKTTTTAKANECMCRGDLIAIVAATLMAKGGLPTASALESAKYIAEAAHESA